MDKNRQSIRLKNYDYSKNGLYFVTICTENREFLFGDVINGKMVLNDVGNMIEKSWNKIPERFNMVELDAFQIGDIIGTFKSLTTHEYIVGVKNNGWKPFDKRLWQRNYYEHIIRTENDLNKIREYIKINPQIWNRDRNNI